MKKLLCVILAVVLTAAVTACAAAPYDGVFSGEDFIGRWVKNGETGGVVCVVDKGGYTLYDEGSGETVATGTYVIEETLVDSLGGGQVKVTCAVLTADDGRSDHGGILRPDDSGHALYQFSGNHVYIRESVLGRREGDALLDKYRVVRATWIDRSYTSGLYFDVDGTLVRRLFNSKGAYETKAIGTWSVANGRLVMKVGLFELTYDMPASAIEVEAITYIPQYKE
jgi:hypothetical protein